MLTKVPKLVGAAIAFRMAIAIVTLGRMFERRKAIAGAYMKNAQRLQKFARLSQVGECLTDLSGKCICASKILGNLFDQGVDRETVIEPSRAEDGYVGLAVNQSITLVYSVLLWIELKRIGGAHAG